MFSANAWLWIIGVILLITVIGLLKQRNFAAANGLLMVLAATIAGIQIGGAGMVALITDKLPPETRRAVEEEIAGAAMLALTFLILCIIGVFFLYVRDRQVKRLLKEGGSRHTSKVKEGGYAPYTFPQ